MLDSVRSQIWVLEGAVSDLFNLINEGQPRHETVKSQSLRGRECGVGGAIFDVVGAVDTQY
jgi:hypothetical protein